MTDRVMVEAYWDGLYPTLCFGTWTLRVNGKDVSALIPKELRHNEMNTYGTYQSWYFDEDWLEVFEDYEDGLDCDEWVSENKYWLDTITDDTKVQDDIYYAISENDWRHGSCGGCI